MTLRLIEYDASTPSQPLITRSGYLDFETRRHFLESRGVIMNKWQAEAEDGEIPLRYMYDVHRRIEDYLNYKDGKLKYLDEEDFKEAVLEFADIYGCWFSASVVSKDYKLHHVDEWRNEWKEVVDATTELKPETIENKLNQLTNMSIDKSGRIAVRPMSIGGWVWALIAKDYFDGITYTACPNSKCTREIPSVTPTTGRPLKYCSQSCKNAVHYKAKLGTFKLGTSRLG